MFHITLVDLFLPFLSQPYFNTTLWYFQGWYLSFFYQMTRFGIVPISIAWGCGSWSNTFMLELHLCTSRWQLHHWWHLLVSSDFGLMLSVGGFHFDNRFCTSKRGRIKGVGWVSQPKVQCTWQLHALAGCKVVLVSHISHHVSTNGYWKYVCTCRHCEINNLGFWSQVAARPKQTFSFGCARYICGHHVFSSIWSMNVISNELRMHTLKHCTVFL